jgi:hypothetical protein
MVINTNIRKIKFYIEVLEALNLMTTKLIVFIFGQICLAQLKSKVLLWDLLYNLMIQILLSLKFM